VDVTGHELSLDLDILVIGAGQAGLALGFHLRKTPFRFQIVDRNVRVGDSWRKRFESLVLFTPRAYSALPGLAVRVIPMAIPRRTSLPTITTRPITVSMTTDDRGMQWLINGKTHEMDEFPFVVQRGAKEIWEIHNDEKSMPHPMHIHGFQFRVLERIGTPEQVAHLVVMTRVDW
jgi:FtsP/CotA-like multicopper oxidase with cupredoxin domain